MKLQRIVPIAFLALVVAAPAAFGWSDVDVRLTLIGLDGVDLKREGSRCVHRDDTDSREYKDDDSIHVSFIQSGDDGSHDCGKEDDKYLDVQLIDVATGVNTCNLRVGRKSGGQYYAQGTSGEGYLCSSSTMHDSMVVTIQTQ